MTVSPKIEGESKSEVIEYLHNSRHYWHLLPQISQTTNIFFGEVAMQIKDKWWDIFEFFEYEVSSFENSFLQEIIEQTNEKQADRMYFKLYLRAD